MTTKESILKEIKKMPEPLLEEVLDFILFLENKPLGEEVATTIASESSLKKDWLKQEEDEAWKSSIR